MSNKTYTTHKTYTMETLIQITGVQYACQGADIPAVMAAMQQEKPEVLLVMEQTHDYGTIVRALVGTQYRGVVSRFDLEQVLGVMRHNGVAVLVGKVADADCEGRCYNISLAGDYTAPDCPAPSATDLWTGWSWTGAPLLEATPEESRLEISLKVALSELRRGSKAGKRTMMEHLMLVLHLMQWDVSHETQEQLSQIRRLVQQHPDSDVRALAPQLRHDLTALGSRERTRQFRDCYLPHLRSGVATQRMYRQWCAIHADELSNPHQRKPAMVRELQAIEDCLKRLPADLYYQTNQFGALMHRLLYLHVPRQKLTMLLSALVLRHLLREQLGLADEHQAAVVAEVDNYLVWQLVPVFQGNADYAREFLTLVRGQLPTEITHLVCLWVKSNRICRTHCHRRLWTILHEAGIYKPTESNWNMQVVVRKAQGA